MTVMVLLSLRGRDASSRGFSSTGGRAAAGLSADDVVPDVGVAASVRMMMSVGAAGNLRAKHAIA